MEAAESFIGCSVVINCGREVKYEGIVTHIDLKEQVLTLSEVFHNCVKIPSTTSLSILASNITDLKILKTAKDKKWRDFGKADDSENNKKKKGFNSPRDSRVTKSNDAGRKCNTKMAQKHAVRDEQCFGESATCPSMPDFDFEKNLALFDKESVFENLKAKGLTAPTTNQQTVDNSERKLKPHETVLEKEPVPLMRIKVPLQHVGKEYSSDNGLVVPAISLQLRHQLMQAASQAGLSLTQLNESAGMCASIMALQLVGGNSRVCVKNSHQSAEIVVLAGPHVQGLQAITAARHLVNHTINVKLFVPDLNPMLLTSVSLFTKTGGKVVRSIRDLMSHPVDLIIDAMIGHSEPDAAYDWLASSIHWANQNKAPVLSLDPCRHTPLAEEIDIKWAVAMALPLINVPRIGRLYVADVGIPRDVFKEVGIAYHSPFLDKFYVALHD